LAGLSVAYRTKKLQEDSDTVYVPLPPKSFFLTRILIPGWGKLGRPQILLKVPIGFRFLGRQRYSYYDIEICTADVFPHLSRYRAHEIARSHTADQE